MWPVILLDDEFILFLLFALTFIEHRVFVFLFHGFMLVDNGRHLLFHFLFADASVGGVVDDGRFFYHRTVLGHFGFMGHLSEILRDDD